MLLDEHRERIRQYLATAEGVRLHPYWDCCGRRLRLPCSVSGGFHRGKLTIGIGRNIEDVGITNLEAYYLLNNDIDRAITQVVGRYAWIEDHDPVRQAVLVELMFNMGPETLKQFVNTLNAFKRKDYIAAAEGLKQSKWYRQVQPLRSSRLIAMTLTGVWA
jgi:lysozyme